MTTINKKLLFWSISLFLLCWFFYSVRAILLPFVVGILIGYFLNPPVKYLTKKGISRSISSLIIILTFFSILALSAVFFGPVLFEQLQAMLTQLPKYVARFQTDVMPYIEKQIRRIDPQIVMEAHEQAEKQSSELAVFLGLLLGNIWMSGLLLLHIASLILITPVVAFYMLRDWDKFIAKINSLLPREYAKTIREQARKIDNTIASYIRGQLNVCFLLAVYYSISLTLAGLNFGFLIGFITGLVSFIPYVGVFVGAGLGLSVAFFQFGADDATSLILIASIFGIGSILDGSLISPKIVGDKIGVHPAWLIFGMLSGGALLGMAGVIIAVPVTAVIGVLVKFAIEQYSHSEFYAPQNALKKPAKKTR